MLSKVKLALRITHDMLDSDITETISQARTEMVRAGVPEALANSNNELIEGAIKTFCLYIYTGDVKKSEQYFESWQYQLDNIRKSNISEESVNV